MLSRSSVLHAGCKWMAAPSGRSVTEAPASMMPVDRQAIAGSFPLYGNTVRWLTNQPSEATDTSSCNAGQNPVDEQEKGRGQTKDVPKEHDPPSLSRETDTREMFYAKAKETEERLAVKGKQKNGSTAPETKPA